MAAEVVGGAAVEVTIDLSKFGSEGAAQIKDALSAPAVRESVTAGLDKAAEGAGESGKLAAQQFAVNITSGGATITEAGAAAGEAATTGMAEGVEAGSAKVVAATEAAATEAGAAGKEKMAAEGAESGAAFKEGALESLKGLATAAVPLMSVFAGGELLKSSVEAADQLEGANIKIENVFGESGEKVQEWATGVATSLRESALQAETTAGAFGGFLSGLGVGKDQSADLAEQLTSLTANMAAFNNADPAAVQEALTGALKGRTNALKQYGVTLTAGQVQQEALTHATELGLTVTNGTVPALNTQQKALATLYAVMDATKNQQGALASTSDTLKAKQQILTAEFQNFQAKLGQFLLPILAAIAGFITDKLIPAIANIASWISANVVPALAVMADWFEAHILPVIRDLANFISTDFIPAVKAISQWIDDNKPTVLTFVGIIGAAAAAFGLWTLAISAWEFATKIATAVQAAFNAIMDANPIILVVVAIAALAAGLVYAYTHSATFRDIVDDIGRALRTVWNDVLKPVADFFEKNWKMALEVALAVFMPFIGLPLLVQQHWGQITAFFKKMWTDITGAFSTALSWIEQFFTSLPGKILGWLGDLGALLLGAGKDILNGLWNGIQTEWATVVGFFTGIPSTVLGWFTGALGWLAQIGQDVMNGLWGGIKGIWNKEVTGFENIGTTIKGWFTGAGTWLLNIGSDIINGLWSGIKNAISSAGSMVSDIAGDIVSGIKTALNNLLHLPWSIPKISLPTSPWTSIDFGPWTLIPRLAGGGMTQGPGTFVMGDNPTGQEVALPLGSSATTAALATALSKASTLNNGPATHFGGGGPTAEQWDDLVAAVQDAANGPRHLVINSREFAKLINDANSAQIWGRT